MSVLERLGLNSRESTRGKSYSKGQTQTRDAFSFKWSEREKHISPGIAASGQRWLFERYCDHDPQRLRGWLAGGRKIILDAGCGSGWSALLFFGDHLKDHDYLGIDISDAVAIARDRFQVAGYPGEFLKIDLMDLPIPDETVDMVFSEGVLHHTDDTGNSLKSLARKLKPGGRFLFYVYAKKGAIREFTDDYVREHLRTMSDEEALRALEPLTKLGVALGRLNVKIDVPEAIPYLGIPKGKMDLQRFFYWYVCKQYYHPEFSLSEMNLVNFDWFRPLNCHRHTVEEIRQWCKEASLSIEHLNTQESGITVVAVKAKRNRKVSKKLDHPQVHDMKKKTQFKTKTKDLVFWIQQMVLHPGSP